MNKTQLEFLYNCMDDDLYRMKLSLSDVNESVRKIDTALIQLKTLIIHSREEESQSINKTDSYDFNDIVEKFDVDDTDGSYTEVLSQSMKDKQDEIPWADDDPKVDAALKKFVHSLNPNSFMKTSNDGKGLMINGRFYKDHYILGKTAGGTYVVNPKGYVFRYNWDKDKGRWVKYDKSERTQRYVCTLVNNEVGEERYKLIKESYQFNSTVPIKFHKMWRDATGEGRASKRQRGGYSNSLRKEESTHFDLYMEIG